MSTEATRELVDALIAGDTLGIESTFDKAMSQKISDKLEDLRTRVAGNMFNPPQQVDAEEETEQE